MKIVLSKLFKIIFSVDPEPCRPGVKLTNFLPPFDKNGLEEIQKFGKFFKIFLNWTLEYPLRAHLKS